MTHWPLPTLTILWFCERRKHAYCRCPFTIREIAHTSLGVHMTLAPGARWEGAGCSLRAPGARPSAPPAPVAMVRPRRPVQRRAGGELVLRPHHEPRSVPRGTPAGGGYILSVAEPRVCSGTGEGTGWSVPRRCLVTAGQQRRAAVFPEPQGWRALKVTGQAEAVTSSR